MDLTLMVWKNMLAFPSPKNMTVILCALNLGCVSNISYI